MLFLFPAVAFAEPVAHTPPLPGEPTHMTANYTLSNGQVISFELFWDEKIQDWKGISAGEEFEVSELPEKDDERFKIYATEWCGCES